MPPTRPRIGILAGEASGDNLGAGLMAALKRRHPAAEFVGVGGPRMLAEGLVPLAPMERLAMNGFVEPVKRLPELLGTLRGLLAAYRRDPPDVFVGVDFNVFNLLLERRLKRRGVPCVHYVSPSVYAWRRGRVRRISRSAHMLLTLYPFEPAFYAGQPVRAVYVGHPLADEISHEAGGEAARAAARAELGISAAAPCFAVLPGSRLSEVRLMGDLFLEAARRVAERKPGAVFVVPCYGDAVADWLEARLRSHPAMEIRHYRGNARRALVASDAALVKSGTSTLEAMLIGRPMVVSYRLPPVTYQVVRRLVRSPFVALPNILAGSRLVPELLQDAATPEALAENLLAELDKAHAHPEYLARFRHLHAELRKGADECAAAAVAEWLGR